MLRAWLSPLGLNALVSILSSFGVLWVCVEILDYFFGDRPWIGWFRSNWWLFLVVGLVAGLGRTIRPTAARITNTDMRVQVRIGNVFSRRFGGAILVGSNATFDTSIEHGEISVDSVQAQLTQPATFAPMLPS